MKSKKKKKLRSSLSDLPRDLPSDLPVDAELDSSSIESADLGESQDADDAANDELATQSLKPRVEEQRLLEITIDLIGQKFPALPSSVEGAAGLNEGGSSNDTLNSGKLNRGEPIRIVAVSRGRGQAARELAKLFPSSNVSLWYIDGYVASLAAQSEDWAENFELLCQADWPTSFASAKNSDSSDTSDPAPIDFALVPLTKSGEVELSRELLQSAYGSLKIGGILVASVDNPKDRWLHEQLKSYEKSVKVRSFEDAAVYFIEKTRELRKEKNFQCEVTFKDCDTLLTIVTRPSVFSHRSLDGGARQLLDAVDVFPEARLLDIGCGAGGVAIGLAARDPAATVHAIDSNARAVACTLEGAKRNQLDNLTAEVDFDGSTIEPSSFDMCLANPPYFADFRIAAHFVAVARKALRPGGRLVLVTKHPRWYAENIAEEWDEFEMYESGRYHIVSGLKPKNG